MADGDQEAERREEVSRASSSDALPAGLEEDGREEGLVHGPEVHPSGARADHRHSVPGTSLPGGPEPAAAGDECEQVRDAAEGRRRGQDGS